MTAFGFCSSQPCLHECSEQAGVVAAESFVAVALISVIKERARLCSLVPRTARLADISPAASPGAAQPSPWGGGGWGAQGQWPQQAQNWPAGSPWGVFQWAVWEESNLAAQYQAAPAVGPGRKSLFWFFRLVGLLGKVCQLRLERPCWSPSEACWPFSVFLCFRDWRWCALYLSSLLLLTPFY